MTLAFRDGISQASQHFINFDKQATVVLPVNLLAR